MSKETSAEMEMCLLQSWIADLQPCSADLHTCNAGLHPGSAELYPCSADLHPCSVHLQGNSLAAPFLKPWFRKPLLSLPGCLIMGNVSQWPCSYRAHSSTPDTPATSDTINSSVSCFILGTPWQHFFICQAQEEIKNSKYKTVVIVVQFYCDKGLKLLSHLLLEFST